MNNRPPQTYTITIGVKDDRGREFTCEMPGILRKQIMEPGFATDGIKAAVEAFEYFQYGIVRESSDEAKRPAETSAEPAAKPE